MSFIIPDDNTSINKKLFFVSLLLISGLSLSMLYMFINTERYLGTSDSYYYISIVDSLKSTGTWRVLVTIPSTPLKTPQNAIVVVLYILRSFFSSPKSCLLAVVFINYAMLHLSLFPLLKIAERFGISRLQDKIAISIIYLCKWNVFWSSLAPLNDCFFSTCSIWLIYLIILLTEEHIGLKQLFLSKKKLFLATIILSLFVIHCRLNAFVIPVAAICTCVLIKKLRSLPLPFFLSVMMFLSIVLPYSFADLSLIQNQGSRLLSMTNSQHLNSIWYFFSGTLPGILLMDFKTLGNIVYALFALSLLIVFIDGVRKRKFDLLFVVLVCVFTIIFVLMWSRVPYRYLLLVYPFLYIFLFYKPSFRFIGYLFALAIFMQTVMALHDDPWRSPKIDFWTYISNNIEVDETNYVLFTRKHIRNAYFYTGMRTFKKEEYIWQDIENKEVYLVGSEAFLEKQKAELEGHIPSHYKFNYINLTEDYPENVSYDLLKMTALPKGI